MVVSFGTGWIPPDPGGLAYQELQWTCRDSCAYVIAARRQRAARARAFTMRSSVVHRVEGDLDRVAELLLQILLEAVHHPPLELPCPFARDAEAVTDLLERERLLRHGAKLADLPVASQERLSER